MAENLNLNVNVNTSGAEGSVGSLKKQLREAQAEVAALSDKFGATSKEAVTAAKKAAELRDRIGDAKALTDAFNPDAKFKALTASLSGVAGGFGAVQGAMALFGSESENVQKTLLKVQSAMALSQGLQAVGESIDSFKQLGAVIRTQVVGAFSTLRGAIIATGVGALAVGLGLLVANFDKVKETIIKIFPSLEGFGDKVKGIINGITDFIGVTSQAERDAELLSKAIDKITDSYDIAIQELEAQGGREEEVYDLKKKRIQAQLSALTDANDKEYKQRAKLNSDLKILEYQEENRRREIQIENLEYAIKTEIDAENKKYERLKEVKDKIGKQEIIDWKEIKENQKKDKEDIEKENEERANEILKAGLDRRTQTTFDALEMDKNAAKEKIRLYNLEIETKKKQFEEITNITGALTDVIGRDTVAGKAFGIATATINTYQGASEALKQKSTLPSPFDVIAKIANVAAIIGTGLKTVKSIASVNIPYGGGGGVSMPSVNSMSPITPQVPMTNTTNISQQSINDIGNQALRAYVIESDVTSNQQRIAAIRQRARFS